MGNYAVQLAAFAKKASVNADAVVRKVVLDMGTRIVERSPVGDGTLWKHPPPKGYVGGRFRANWQYGNYSEGGIPMGELPDIDPSPAESNVSTMRILAGLPGEKAAGMVHVLINNLPYAQRLEDGWSTQAPAGMVGLAVLEFQAVVDSAARGMA